MTLLLELLMCGLFVLLLVAWCLEPGGEVGFIRRWHVHAEWHAGYRPRFWIRRAPRPGDTVTDGGEQGRLVGCYECSTVGFLFVPEHQLAAYPRPLYDKED